ncbi:hypothetical protein WJX72_012260 [[Myrmecia] bisecta]|uniref:Uncharacterized protein n=1 Tax=[Myrmecia] bisecta TaxID=41462 RepID=A0AAW1PF07_9CHLO
MHSVIHQYAPKNPKREGYLGNRCLRVGLLLVGTIDGKRWNQVAVMESCACLAEALCLPATNTVFPGANPKQLDSTFAWRTGLGAAAAGGAQCVPGNNERRAGEI